MTCYNVTANAPAYFSAVALPSQGQAPSNLNLTFEGKSFISFSDLFCNFIGSKSLQNAYLIYQCRYRNYQLNKEKQME